MFNPQSRRLGLGVFFLPRSIGGPASGVVLHPSARRIFSSAVGGLEFYPLIAGPTSDVYSPGLWPGVFT